MRPMQGEQGSASIETAIGAPGFVLFVGLIIFGGRTATTHQALESAAADAARSASLERTTSAAEASAEQAARASLENQQIACEQVDVVLDTSGFQARVGQDALVSVTVSCRLNLSDLSVPGVPGSRDLRATSTSPIDTWRERA